MKPPALKVHEAIAKEAILIVDKIGVIGEELAREFSKDYMVLLVSPKRPSGKNQRLGHIAFKNRIPQIPDNIYSKIFVVDDGRAVTKKSSSSFIKKAEETNAEFYFIGSIRNVDVKHAEEITNSYQKAKVLIFGDLFDKNIFFDKEESITKFIIQARKQGKVEVEGSGLSLSYPISFKDTIRLIIKASYLDIPQRNILLFYPHPITDLSLANTFKKLNPDIGVDFVDGNIKKEIYIPEGAQHALSKYDLMEKLKELELDSQENRKIKLIKDRKEGRGIARPILFAVLLLLFVLLLPFLTTFTYAFLGQGQLSGARKSLEAGDLQGAKKKIERSITFFDSAIKTAKPLQAEATFVGRESDADAIVKRIEAGRELSSASIGLIEGLEGLRAIYRGESKDNAADFVKSANSLKGSLSSIQEIKAEGNLPEEIEEELEDIEPFVDLFSNSSEVLPELLGFDSERKYLILMQDNSEIRGGGGKIESIGILSVKNGKVQSLKIERAADIDKKIRTEVNPPFFLERYLGTSSLSFSDSNYDPDFVTNAVSAANLLSLADYKNVDGVIGIDRIFIKNLISALGEVEVEGELIDEENFEELRLSSEDGTFLGKSTRAIYEKLESKDKKSYFSITQEIGKSINGKHLSFAFPKQSYQNLFTANNWSSSLWDERPRESSSILDYLGIIDSNLGKNKANDFVSRSVSKKLVISDKGNVSSELTIAYKNNSPSGDSQNDYKNYLQLVLPEQTILRTIMIDGESIEIEKAVEDPNIYKLRGFRPPSGLEVSERNHLDKSIFGFYFTVSSLEVKTLKFVYDLPYVMPSTKKSARYSLRVFKQPGAESYPLELTSDLPENYKSIPEIKSSQEVKTDEDFDYLITQK